jgi:hypothetical protein
MQIEDNSLKAYRFRERGKPMKHDTNWKVLKEKEVKMAFNMGLRSAVNVLEKAEKLSPRGLRYLTDELKKNIAESNPN